MNERIRELVRESNLDVYGLGKERYKWEYTVEKFAELIVKECVQTLLDNTPDPFTNEAAEEDWDRGYDQAMRDCVHHIKEHFGVEG